MDSFKGTLRVDLTIGNVANITAVPENQVVPWLPCLLPSSRYVPVHLFHTAYLPLKSGNKQNEKDDKKPLIHHHISIENFKIKVFHVLSIFHFY